jgi:hypothetical protein
MYPIDAQVALAGILPYHFKVTAPKPFVVKHLEYGLFPVQRYDLPGDYQLAPLNQLATHALLPRAPNQRGQKK